MRALCVLGNYVSLIPGRVCLLAELRACRALRATFARTAQSTNTVTWAALVRHDSVYGVYSVLVVRHSDSSCLVAFVFFAPSVAVTTFVDGSASMDSAGGIAFDATGTTMFIADTTNHQIRGFSSTSGASTSFLVGSVAGFVQGIGLNARMSRPFGLVADQNGNLFVSEQNNDCITKIVISTRQTSLLAGGSATGSADGVGTNAQFNIPMGIAVRQLDVFFCSLFFILLFWCSCDLAFLLLVSLLRFPVQIDSVGAKIYVADLNNRLIRVVLTSNGAVSTLAGSGAPGGADGIGVAASFTGPVSVTLDPAGQTLYIAERDGTCASVFYYSDL